MVLNIDNLTRIAAATLSRRTVMCVGGPKALLFIASPMKILRSDLDSTVEPHVSILLEENRDGILTHI